MQEDHNERMPEDPNSEDANPFAMSGGPVAAEIVDRPSPPAEAQSPFVEYYQPPRLSIAHLLIWTVLAAVLMKVAIVYGLMSAGPDGEHSWIRVAQTTLMCSHAVVVAAALLATIVLICDKLRGAVGRLQPGHWLVMISSIFNILTTIISLCRLTWADRSSPDYNGGLLWNAVVYFAVAIAYLFLTIRLREGWRWRVVMFLLMFQAAVEMAFSACIGSGYDYGHRYLLGILQSLGTILSVVAVIALLITLLIDLARKKRRDGMHWLGVLVLAWQCIGPILWAVVSLFANI